MPCQGAMCCYPPRPSQDTYQRYLLKRPTKGACLRYTRACVPGTGPCAHAPHFTHYPPFPQPRARLVSIPRDDGCKSSVGGVLRSSLGSAKCRACTLNRGHMGGGKLHKKSARHQSRRTGKTVNPKYHRVFSSKDGSSNITVAEGEAFYDGTAANHTGLCLVSGPSVSWAMVQGRRSGTQVCRSRFRVPGLLPCYSCTFCGDGRRGSGVGAIRIS